MQKTVSSSTVSTMQVPPTQNTAPVLEFNCLYTHDIRRKAKRWQDGVVKFHTFNRRLMVYDVSRNFIGDAHWTDSNYIQDGDEATLDKGGILVQVADQIGQTQTDLTELIKSKYKAHKGSSPLAKSSGNMLPSGRTPVTLGRTQTLVARAALQPKHRSLNALLGSDRTVLGKSVLPQKSPFEIRQAAKGDEQSEVARPSKRQRREPPQPAQSIGRDLPQKADEVSSRARSIESTDPDSADSRRPREKAASDRCSGTRVDSASSRTRLESRSDSMHTRADLDVADESLPSRRLILTKIAPRRKLLACQEEADAVLSKPRDVLPQRQKLNDRIAKARATTAKRFAQEPNLASDDVDWLLDASKTEPTVKPAAKVSESTDRSAERAPNFSILQRENIMTTLQDPRALTEIIEVESRPVQSGPSTDPALEQSVTAMHHDPVPPPKPHFTTIVNVPPDKDVTTLSAADADRAQKYCRGGQLDSAGDVLMTTAGTNARRRRKGISRKEIRESAAACFQTRQSTKGADMSGAAADGLSNFHVSTSHDDMEPYQAAVEAKKDKEVGHDNVVASIQGPWSREAFDLFKWRPPRWDENSWCIKAS